MFASRAASASIMSAPRRNSPALPVGEMPKGLEKVCPKIVADWSRFETSTSYRVSPRFSTIRNSAGLTCTGPVRRAGTALRGAAGLFELGTDVPQFREEDPAGDLLQIADPGSAAGAALLADDARDDLEMAVA